MYELFLHGDKAKLDITVYGFENPKATNESDASWLTVHVDVKLPNFGANYDAAFTIQNFEYFSNEMAEALNKIEEQPEVNFYTDEEMLRFSMRFTKTGKVSISGKSQIHDKPRAVLDFYFEADLYTVENFYKQVNKMLKELKQ